MHIHMGQISPIGILFNYFAVGTMQLYVNLLEKAILEMDCFLNSTSNDFPNCITKAIKGPFKRYLRVLFAHYKEGLYHVLHAGSVLISLAILVRNSHHCLLGHTAVHLQMLLFIMVLICST